MEKENEFQGLKTPSFYGRRRNSKTRSLSEKCKLMEENPLPADFKSKIDGPSSTWKIFKTQEEAIKYMTTQTKDAKVFSFEQKIPGNKGKRTFLVAHPKHLWQVHKQRPPNHRCTYEVIVKDSPCKLYFDLEFNKLINETKDGSELVETFIECVCKHLKEKYNLDCNKSNVLWLDASTKSKFSSHLIFLLNGAYFRNNIEAGKFVNYVCLNIMDQISSQEVSKDLSSAKLLDLLIKNTNGKETLFCDLTVYSKNRNFRLYLSTKYRKNAPLILSERNKYKDFQTDAGDYEENIFLDSLITYFRSNDHKKMLTWDEPLIKHIKECNNDSCKFIISSETLCGFRSSPYPEVDNFIQNVVNKSTTKPGYIRCWSYFPSSEILLYNIENYRYCENINRHHKSNHIMLIADLKEGVYYQKCYDSECRSQNFRSKVRKLPTEVLPSYFAQDSFTELDDGVTESDEKALIEAILSFEASPEYRNILNSNV